MLPKQLNIALAERPWILWLCLGYALTNGVLIAFEQYWALLISLGIALVAAIVLALDKVLLFLVFTVPLSIFYFNPELHIGFTLPTEPILFGIMILFFFRLIYDGGYDRKIAFHPLSLSVLAMLVWMVFTTVSSSMPLISAKFTLSQLWFVTVFFYFLALLFLNPKQIVRFFWLYMIPLAGVVLYTLYIHAQHGFDKDTAVWVMFPFFKEHTSYGAVLAMFLPISFVFAFVLKQGLNLRVLATVVFLILLVGTIFSYTRAAWVSLVAALVFMAILVLRVRTWMVVSGVLLVGLVLLLNLSSILARFEKNKSVSSDNLGEHVESISNISTDASNMERINRWKSAYRMFEERPILGWGPGTYMFQYAPFQKPHEKTIISTNAGDMGNAHSEYIGPLAEQGIPGMLIKLSLVLITLITAVRVYKRTEDPKYRLIGLAVGMGLVTYWTHGLLNNFLEMDKASCPVWGFSCMLVILDRFYAKK